MFCVSMLVIYIVNNLFANLVMFLYTSDMNILLNLAITWSVGIIFMVLLAVVSVLIEAWINEA